MTSALLVGTARLPNQARNREVKTKLECVNDRSGGAH